MITLSLIFIVLLAPLGNIALAKDDQGIGVKNELTTSNKETMDSLPTDSELEQQVKGNKADIVTAGKSKKIPKGKGGIWKAYKDEIKDEMEVRKKNGMPSSMQKFAEEFDTTTGLSLIHI